ncbi:hypothetical protein DL95DRAFT_414153 [Leptodontidium sp. 2 PMI_412]|nr:hypothetical protein DL95DRAFT_414153 [Leptodontidium sp. 2 PMI_412]
MSNPSNSSSSTDSGLRMAGQTLPNPFLFDAGDVQILVSYKEKPLVGMICSQALLHASPVLKKFIFPPWKVAPPFLPLPKSETESTESPRARRSTLAVISTSSQAPFATIDCTEDDGEAVLVLLNIIHLKHRLVPKRLQFSILLQVAVLCEKYMCVDLVQPWLSTWTDNLKFRTKYPMAEQVLYTHWVFGQEEEFETVAKSILLEVKTNKDGQLLNKYGWLWSEPFPPGIAENIFRIRKETIESLLAIPHAMVSKYEKTNDNLCQLGDVTGEDNACDGTSWGSLTRGMQIAGLWPIKPVDEVYLSIDEIASAIESIHIYYLHTHHGCGKSNFHQEVGRALRRIENPVMDSHKIHMARQRALMGI